ncbi:MAG TPA: ATP phosphoribosyltransferase regulatory subunit [Thermomicrobiaceae bacterium]|nr:ATP phosphoribosyltransferase regulatory subunit [Thermomicrobiaceae bacterium]
MSERAQPVERLRGMVDLAPETLHRRDLVREQVLGVLARHGYRQIETPVVEATDLFLRKSGGERAAQMYAVRYREREIALRPEHTASVLRLYLDALRGEPLPLRLSYGGPVFRYEKPQAGRTRQFTEVGGELLGGSGPAADAEVIHLALSLPQAVGVESRLVLGHVGLVLDFLNRLPLRQRSRDWLLWSMERLRKGQPVDLEHELAGLVSDGRLTALFAEMNIALRDVPPQQLERWVLSILGEVGVAVQGGNREPEEIVAGVIAKLNQRGDEADVRHAFDFLRELAAVHGAPQRVLPEVRALARRHGLQPAPIDQLEQVLDLLAAYGHDVGRFELNLGLGRGLHYYTGVLFEVYTADSSSQLCGGGRYDDLAQLLGARQPLPACGFSCGLERLVEEALPQPEPAPIDVLVVPANPDGTPAAIRLAEELRGRGQQVELEVRGRSPNAARRYAERRGIRSVLLVDADERVSQEQPRANAAGARDA